MIRDQNFNRCARIFEELDLGHRGEITELSPLTGGVSSDIFRIVLSNREYCVKFAVPQLRVAEHWAAPVHRNFTEYQWLQFASSMVPDSVPKLYGCSKQLNGFVMEYFPPNIGSSWKSLLLDKRADNGEACAVAKTLVAIHAASTGVDLTSMGFENQDDFKAIRLDPYLLFSAKRNPAIAKTLMALSESLYASRIALVHGDVSPKNILIRASGLVLLDAECATIGDPAFDVAFCLNHLCLKAFHMPDCASDLLQSVVRFWNEYSQGITWEASNALQARVAQLLPALMLARVDGKSPVEYLSELNRERVRSVAIPLLKLQPETLATITDAIQTQEGF